MTKRERNGVLLAVMLLERELLVGNHDDMATTEETKAGREWLERQLDIDERRKRRSAP
jgi:hypothetical protein